MSFSLWRVKLDTYVIIEAETPDEAKREVTARMEQLTDNWPRDERMNLTIERDALLNASVESISLEEEQL